MVARVNWIPLTRNRIRLTPDPSQLFRQAWKAFSFPNTCRLLAEQAHHLSIIRSMVSREGNHERARYLLHTGYAPTGSVKHPTLGSIASHYLNDEDFELPNCVNINAPAFSSGFLSAEHDPFVVSDPMKPIEDLKYPPQMDARRFHQRLQMLTESGKRFPQEAFKSEYRSPSSHLQKSGQAD